MRLCLIFVAAACLFLWGSEGNKVNADALERMKLSQLKNVHEAIELLKQDRQPVEIDSGFTDYRGLMHVHSHLSHDSHGTIKEIVKAAHETGVKVIMFTDHPADSYDTWHDGHRGMVEGVLLIPGAETNGLLCYPKASVQKSIKESPQELVNAVDKTGGMSFLCHLEERMDWELEHLQGSEIYNIHAEYLNETRLLEEMRNPLVMMLKLAPAVRQYPTEFMGALQDYPADYLKKYDSLCQIRPHTGIAANDAHQNQGIAVTLVEGGKLRVTDGLEEEVAVIDPADIPLLAPLLLSKKEGDRVFELLLDPYARSFKHVSTHMLLTELTEPAVEDALRHGRAYVAFDWLTDPTGFVFQALTREKKYPMGSELSFQEDLEFQIAAPLAGTIRLLKEGKELFNSRISSAKIPVKEPGIYRAEVWLNIGGEPKIWILSNPIYVR